MRNKLLIFLLFLGLVSCDENRLFEETKNIETGSWNASEPVSFSIDIQDTVNTVDFLVTLRNSSSYKYSNLWLFIEYKNPKGFSKTDTIECPLALPNGKWIGSGIGDILDNRIMFKKGARFPTSGNYTFTIQHGMRDTLLEGIFDVGLRLQYTQ